MSIDYKALAQFHADENTRLRTLLGRCIEALESEKIAAADKLAMNKGYPARAPRFERWYEEASALYDEVVKEVIEARPVPQQQTHVGEGRS